MQNVRSKPAQPAKRSLADHVYDELKGMLFESRFAPGDWIPVDEVAGELNVSRQPVMDAVKRLAIEGFVVVVPQVGCKVREYSGDEIHEFFDLFAEGEAVVAELAAKRATADDVVKLQIMSGQIEQLSSLKLGKFDLARVYRGLNRTLHSEIRRIARSAPVTEIVEAMGDRSDFFVATSGRPMFAETLTAAQTEHLEIIAAISKGNASAARDAMRRHVLGTDKRLQDFLKDDPAKRASRTAKPVKRLRA